MIGQKGCDAATPRVTLHVVSSIDGFIAKPDNSVSWMDSPADSYEKGVTGAEADSLDSIDCYVLGSRTYEHALQLGWPYGDTPTFVMTARDLPSARPTVQFYSGSPATLVNEILTPHYKNIWLVGGANLAQNFLEMDLVSELWLMIAPTTLGTGLHLFGSAGQEQRWRLKNVAGYRNGYVELRYERQNSADTAHRITLGHL